MVSQNAENWDDLPAIYDTISEAFDHLAVPITFAPPARDLVALLRLPPAARVLDVGGGTGTAALLALSASGPRSTVVVLDPSLGMLRLARRKGLISVAGAVPGSPFPDGMFDRVIANFVLSHVPCYRTALLDIMRVLRSSGLVGVTTWGSSQNDCRKRWQRIAEQFVSREELLFGVRRFLPWEEWFSEPEHLENAFREAGLECIKVHHAEYKPKMAVDDFLAMREITYQARLMRKFLGPGEWSAFRRQVRKEFQSRYSATVEDARDAYIAVGAKPHDWRREFRFGNSVRMGPARLTTKVSFDQSIERADAASL